MERSYLSKGIIQLVGGAILTLPCATATVYGLDGMIHDRSESFTPKYSFEKNGALTIGGASLGLITLASFWTTGLKNIRRHYQGRRLSKYRSIRLDQPPR